MEILEGAVFPDIHRARVYVFFLADALSELLYAFTTTQSPCGAQCSNEGLQDDAVPRLLISRDVLTAFSPFVTNTIAECDHLVAAAMSSDFELWKRSPHSQRKEESDGNCANNIDDGDNAYVAYCKSNAGLPSLHERKPIVVRALQQKLRDIVDSAKTALHRIRLGWGSIWEHRRQLLFGGYNDDIDFVHECDSCNAVSRACVIVALDLLDADPHAGGSPVVFTIRVDNPLNGSSAGACVKLVHKPRGDSGLQWFGTFVDRVFGANGVGDAQIKPKLPFVLQCCNFCSQCRCSCFGVNGDHGDRKAALPFAWASFVIARTDLSSATELREQLFRSRCGALLAFAACVRLTDGHMHNVLRTVDDYPVLVDAETVLTPQPGGVHHSFCTPTDLMLLTGLVEDLRCCPTPEGDKRILRGATSAFQTKRVGCVFRPVIVDDGCDSFRVELFDEVAPTQASEQPSVHKQQAQRHQTPQFAYVDRFDEYFVDGFRRALTLIAKTPADVLWKSPTGLKPPHRVVLRPTVHYNLLRYKALIKPGEVDTQESFARALQPWRPLLPSLQGGTLASPTRMSSECDHIAERIEREEVKQLQCGRVPVWVLVDTQHHVELCILDQGADMMTSTVLSPVASFKTELSDEPEEVGSSPQRASWCGLEAAVAGTITLTSNLTAAVTSLSQLLCHQDQALETTAPQCPHDAQNTLEVMTYLKRSVHEHWLPMTHSVDHRVISRSLPAAVEVSSMSPVLWKWEHTSFYSGSLGVAVALVLGNEWGTAMLLLSPLIDACVELSEPTATPSVVAVAFDRWLDATVGLTGVGGLLFGLSVVLLRSVASGAYRDTLLDRIVVAASGVVTCTSRRLVSRSNPLKHDAEMIQGFGGLLIGLASVCNVLQRKHDSQPLNEKNDASECRMGVLHNEVIDLIQLVVFDTVIPSQNSNDGSFPRLDHKPPYSGLSHGQSGIALSLAQSLEALTLRAAVQKPAASSIEIMARSIQQAFVYEDSNELFSATPIPHWRDLRNNNNASSHCSGSWCHGAAGILVARAHIRSVLHRQGIHPPMSHEESQVRHTGKVQHQSSQCSDICCGPLCCHLAFSEPLSPPLRETQQNQFAPPTFGFHPSCLFKGIAGMWVILQGQHEEQHEWPNLFLLSPFNLTDPPCLQTS